MRQPLAGIRVVEVGQAFAGPLAAAIMGDMGADVIKVEKPNGGDDARGWGPPFVNGNSVMFHACNRNKRSVVLDIKTREGLAAFKALISTADIMIQNLRGGIAEEVGIGSDAMMAINPRLIYCSISAFGRRGPLRKEPGFDPLVQAFSGVMTMTGRPDDPPTFCAPPINDKAAALWCVIGALSSLRERSLTGKGGTIDTSLFESGVSWVEGFTNNYNATGKMGIRNGAASLTLTPYQTFDTADKPICIAVGNDRIFRKFAEAVDRPEWADDERFAKGANRAANRLVLVEMVAALLLEKPRSEWLRRLSDAKVPCSPVNNIAELTQSEQFKAMDVLRTLPDSGGLRVVGLPISFDDERPHPRSDSPKLGQHTEEIMAEIGPLITAKAVADN